MSSFLDTIDKYKYGIIAVLAVYVALFMYLQMDSFKVITYYEPFHDGSYVEIPEEGIELTADNIEIPQNGGPITNAVKDMNDTRDQSYENFSPNMSQEQIDAYYQNLENQMYQESGGQKTREQIKKEMDQRKQNDLSAAQINNSQNNTAPGNTAVKGKTMVAFELGKRTAHQNNNWYVRNPGYTCGYGASGEVVVLIKVNNNGNVTSAVYDAAHSFNANSCMIDAAVEYAKMSRFNYSSAKTESGKIIYTFVSQ